MDKAKQQLPHKITQEDIDLLLLAMTAASKNMQTLREAKHELMELQEDMIEYKDDLSSLKSMLAEGKNDNLGSLKHVEGMPVDRLMAIFETLDTNKDGKIE